MSSQFLFYTATFCLGFFIRSIFSHLFMISTYIRYMQDLENKFLLLSANYAQWKTQAVTILELTYKHRIKHSSEEMEDFITIKKKIEEKSNAITDAYILGIKKILPYNTKYNNFAEAIRHFQKQMKDK